MTRQISVTIFGVSACLECEDKNVRKRKLRNVLRHRRYKTSQKKEENPEAFPMTDPVAS